MKIGAENKKEMVIMACLLAVAVPLVVYTVYRYSGSGASAAEPAAAQGARPQAKSGTQTMAQSDLDPTLRLDVLENSRKVKYEAGGRNIFIMEAEVIQPPIAPVVVTAPPTPFVPTPTPIPPIPLKFFGSENKPGEPRRVFLSEGDGAAATVFVAKQGDIVDRRYKVVQIANTYVVIEDLLTNNKQQIQLTPR
ncbi:MAG: hypothetical protein LAO20_16405 [Acidobacteriia bacterium]|nr:hypothetical protein [Terriglobia bacterium]